MIRGHQPSGPSHGHWRLREPSPQDATGDAPGSVCPPGASPNTPGIWLSLYSPWVTQPFRGHHPGEAELPGSCSCSGTVSDQHRWSSLRSTSGDVALRHTEARVRRENGLGPPNGLADRKPDTHSHVTTRSGRPRARLLNSAELDVKLGRATVSARRGSRSRPPTAPGEGPRRRIDLPTVSPRT